MKVESKEGQMVTLPDGRQLGYLIVGEGKPVFYCHGLSRLEVLIFEEIVSSKHVQIIGVDRPGFGLSTFAPKRRLRDFVSDVCFLADHLGIDKFALVGFCAGGPYGIICAALLPERITRAVVIGGLTLPPDFSGLPKEGQMFHKLVTKPFIGPQMLKKQRGAVLEMANDPDAFMKSEAGRQFLEYFPDDDEKLFASSSESRDVLIRSFVEAYRQGSDGIKAMIQEKRLFQEGWDVNLSKIPSGVLHIWHGMADKNSPISNAYRNAKAIPRAHLEIFENEGHYSLLCNHLEELCEILR